MMVSLFVSVHVLLEERDRIKFSVLPYKYSLLKCDIELSRIKV